MFLVNIKSLRLEAFVDDSQIPPYYILSHTWGSDEVTYQDVRDSPPQALAHREGWQKIQGFCQMLLETMEDTSSPSGLPISAKTCSGPPPAKISLPSVNYVWVDTCCINKESSAELSEAINSMFRWYAQAVACVVFLKDIASHSMLSAEVRSSRWFTRGWTLQELLAPQSVFFYNGQWAYLGERSEYAGAIASITFVQSEILTRDYDLRDASIAERMSWAANRTTTRSEDMAYCLLGLFDINMPLLYGEGGTKAFVRLQEEILRDSTDESIFAWDATGIDGLSGMLAAHPARFRNSGRIVPLGSRKNPAAVRNGDFLMHVACLKLADMQTWDVLLDCAGKGASANVGTAIRVWRSHPHDPDCRRIAGPPMTVLTQRFLGMEQSLNFSKTGRSVVGASRLRSCQVPWDDAKFQLLEAWPGSCWHWATHPLSVLSGNPENSPHKKLSLVNMAQAIALASNAFPSRGNGRLVMALAFWTTEAPRDSFVLGMLLNPASAGYELNIVKLATETSSRIQDFRVSSSWANMCGLIEAWACLREPFVGSFDPVANIGSRKVRAGSSVEEVRGGVGLDIKLDFNPESLWSIDPPLLPQRSDFLTVGDRAMKAADDLWYWKPFFDHK